MATVAKVAVQAATYAIDKVYDYLLPPELAGQVGCRVLVPFGRGNRLSEAVILSLRQEVPDKPLKAVRTLLDEEPILTEKELRLTLWMTRRYFCTFYDALRTVLPTAVWYHYRETWTLAREPEEPTAQEAAVCRLLQDGAMSTDKLRQALGDDVELLLRRMARAGALRCDRKQNRKVQDKVVTLVRLAVAEEEALSLAGRSQRRREVVHFLARSGETAMHDLTYFTGAARQTVNGLQQLGAVAYREQEEYRISAQQYAVKATSLTLNEGQQRVCDTLLRQIEGGEPGVTLLRGVTGSGKTVVYIRLAQERYDQYKRLRRGEAHIVLGTRSAVFAPLDKLGLIVMDEEQEGSYQSENAPCCHARDVAKYRCAAEGARLLLGSATPTVETFYHARQGDYDLLELTERYNRQSLPQVVLADLRQELRSGHSTIISRPLQEELEKNLAAGEQSILFLNRRGSSRQLLCPQCGYVPECPRCSVYLTYHSANDRLMCHYCGYSQRAPEQCPECGGTLKHIGFGTQRVEEELKEVFPGTEVLRMDADTVSGGHEALLREFEQRRIPILLGTQMVAKGLDFENVTLVGVLSADLSLYVDHYRAAERTFNLLTQVVGRAGRGAKTGRAVIQTYTPENDVIQAAAAQDYERFYDAEITLRRLRRDPPFADQFTVTVTGAEEAAVRRAAELLRQGMDAAVKKAPYDALGLDIIGPAPAPVVKVNGIYRYRLLVLGQNTAPVRELLASFMRTFAQRPENRRLHIYTDCDRMD